MSKEAVNYQQNYVLKVCVVGNGGVGKTSIVMQYCDGVFRENYIMTIGSNFAVKNLPLPDLNTYVKLQLWDIAGQKHFSFVRPPFYRGASAIIYVFDITRRDSFLDIPNWKTEVERIVSDKPFILIANKTDLADERVVSKKEGETLAKEIGALKYFETSAKEFDNIDEPFLFLTEKMLE
ncbi:MAG: GTP-binding protein [Candidatus Lokiarchaeota archaeon]|nr:GTP-binding protein [Candidatus Lokiarchaeota archaeon]